MGHVWAADFGGAARKLVALVIADCHNGETGQCNPGAPYIARRTNLSVGNVRKHLAALVEDGFFERDDDGNWTLMLDDDAHQCAQDAHQCARGRAPVRAGTRTGARVIRKEPEVEPEEEPTAAPAASDTPGTQLVVVDAALVEHTPRAQAERWVRQAWEARVEAGKPRPVLATRGQGNAYMALVKIAEQLIDAGHDGRQVGLAIFRNDGAWTMAALLEQMRRGRPAQPSGEAPNDRLARLTAMASTLEEQHATT